MDQQSYMIIMSQKIYFEKQKVLKKILNDTILFKLASVIRVWHYLETSL